MINPSLVQFVAVNLQVVKAASPITPDIAADDKGKDGLIHWSDEEVVFNYIRFIRIYMFIYLNSYVGPH